MLQAIHTPFEVFILNIIPQNIPAQHSELTPLLQYIIVKPVNEASLSRVL